MFFETAEGTCAGGQGKVLTRMLQIPCFVSIAFSTTVNAFPTSSYIAIFICHDLISDYGLNFLAK